MDDILARHYRDNSKPVAFLDESFELEREKAFYIIGAAVVDVDVLSSSRQVLLDFYDGAPLHAGPMYHNREFVTLEQAMSIVSGQTDGCELVICTEVEPGDEYADAARARCLAHIMTKLHREEGVELFIVDSHSTPTKNRKDQDTATALRRDGALPRNSAIHHARPSAEPLLGLPDVLAWAYRQKHVRNDDKWFEPFSDHARISFI
jgi:hypothetical protein